jgi:hypothetical protein
MRLIFLKLKNYKLIERRKYYFKDIFKNEKLKY